MMRARLIVFPIKGRNWVFTRSIDQSTIDKQSAHSVSSFKELWEKLSSSSKSADNAKPGESNTELLIDFASDKMNRAWTGLEKAPAGTFKNKLHGLGLKLLSRVKPSEIFLKSVSKEVTGVDITFPSSLNARLVRRRLRHIAQRGTIIHKKYFYGSLTVLPLTFVLSVLPLPNVPFFWLLFRSYSHWRALQGSERLLVLASDAESPNKSKSSDDAAESEVQKPSDPTWALQPSKELEELYQKIDAQTGLSDCVVSKICEIYDLNKIDVTKYREMT